jgi:23S rRNA pseudouridine2605 synthase
MADAAKIRIQKVLSDHGILSRRKAEEAILQNRVQVNGRPAEIGQKIDPRRDTVTVDGVRQEISVRDKKIYIMLNKPRGYVTTTSDEQGRHCVTELVADAPAKVYPVGRLDKLSEGLLLLTNDGAFANDVMHPRGHVSKSYRVTVRPDITEDMLIKLASGVELDGKLTLPAKVHVLSREPGRTVLLLTIFEGRNRQVRRMCEAIGLEVARLRGCCDCGMEAPCSICNRVPLKTSLSRRRREKKAHSLVCFSPPPAGEAGF